jgi:hypothetical protein
MSDRTGSEKPLEPDRERLWLSGDGAEISAKTVTGDKRALDVVEAVRRRFASKPAVHS